MSFALRVFLLAALAAPVLARDVAAALDDLARQAGVTLVIDRGVTGTVNVEGLTGSPLDRLSAAAERAGLVVMRAEPVAGKTVVMVRAAGPQAIPSGWSPEQERRVALARAAAVEEHAEGAPAKRGHEVHRTGRARKSKHAHARHGAVVEVAPEAPVQVDAMVAAVVPGTVAELAAIGHELAPSCKPAGCGTQYLDGCGPGMKVLSFDRVEPRLNEHLPWAEVGTCRGGWFSIRSRQKVIVGPGGSMQVPLSQECLEDGHREALVKEALVLWPEALPGGRVRLSIGRRRGVAFPHELDPAMVVGGHAGTTVDVAAGQELVITGLGLTEAPHAEVEHVRVDPLERYRRPRLLDRDRGVRHEHAREACPGEVLVRVLVRRVPAGP